VADDVQRRSLHEKFSPRLNPLQASVSEVFEKTRFARSGQVPHDRRLLGTGAEFASLPPKLFGKVHKFASRRIIPRQALCQPQTGFGFIPEICRVHDCTPRGHDHIGPLLTPVSVSGARRLAVMGITSLRARLVTRLGASMRRQFDVGVVSNMG
jgi:hypothetical protein